MAEFAQLPDQLNQEQTEGTGISHKASHYASLINPGTSSHDYTQLIATRMPSNEATTSNQQHPQVRSNASSQDDPKTMPHQVQHYTALIGRPEATSHDYAKLILPEKSSAKSTSDNEQHSKGYSNAVRKDRKKVTVRFAVSDSPKAHQVEHPALAEGDSDHAKKNITSHPSSRNVTPPSDRAVQESAMYSTVVRQGGEKVTIRIQAPTEEQDPW